MSAAPPPYGNPIVARRLEGKLRDGAGTLTPFFATIGPPQFSADGEEAWCRLHCPALLERDQHIHGNTPAQPFDLAENLIHLLAAGRAVDLQEVELPTPADAPAWALHVAERFAAAKAPWQAGVHLHGGLSVEGKTRFMKATISSPVASKVYPLGIRVVKCPELFCSARTFTSPDGDHGLRSAINALRHLADFRGGYFGSPTFV